MAINTSAYPWKEVTNCSIWYACRSTWNGGRNLYVDSNVKTVYNDNGDWLNLGLMWTAKTNADTYAGNYNF